MRWFLVGNNLVPDNMVFFVQIGNDEHETWEWTGGKIMVRMYEENISSLINEIVENEETVIYVKVARD